MLYLQQIASHWSSYRAFVRLLAGVAPHVDHQHVLRLEGLLLSRALVPAAHELLLLAVDVLIVDVLRRRRKSHGGQHRVTSRKTADSLCFFPRRHPEGMATGHVS